MGDGSGPGWTPDLPEKPRGAFERGLGSHCISPKSVTKRPKTPATGNATDPFLVFSFFWRVFGGEFLVINGVQAVSVWNIPLLGPRPRVARLR